MKPIPTIALGLLATALGWQSVAAGPLDPLMKPESRALRQGLKAYEKADWNEAIAKFAQARDAAETPALADFDMGAAAFQNGDYPTAQRSFEQAARSDGLPPGEAAYNLGRTLAEAEQLEPALEAFRAALRENPNHEDARHNYEVVWNQIQNQEDQESEDQQNQDQQNQDQSEDSENSDQDQQNQDQQNQDEQNQDQQNQDQQDPSDQEQNQQEEQQSPPPGEEPPQDGSEQLQPQPGEEQLLTPEEAERLLNALAAQEKDLIEARLKKGKRKRAEKDW